MDAFNFVMGQNIQKYLSLCACDIKKKPFLIIFLATGLYICEDNDQAPEHFRGLGVRIEDDVVIREKGGPLILSSGAPKTVADVEKACGMG